MARPERFELPTTKFVAWYSIQLSYGRVILQRMRIIRFVSRSVKNPQAKMAEREGFEPSMELLTPYSLSRGAPSTYSAISPAWSQTPLFHCRKGCKNKLSESSLQVCCRPAGDGRRRLVGDSLLDRLKGLAPSAARSEPGKRIPNQLDNRKTYLRAPFRCRP